MRVARGVAIGADYSEAPLCEDTRWQLKGLCASGKYDPNLWAPAENHEIEAEKAKEVCYDCPVMLKCAEWALERKERFGVWGGMSEGERDEILSGRKRRRRYERKAC